MNILFDLPPAIKPATSKQLPVWKIVYVELLKGGSIETYGKRMKVRNANRVPVRIVKRESVRPLKDYIKPNKKKDAMVLDRMYIRGMSKRYWVKKMYLLFLKRKV